MPNNEEKIQLLNELAVPSKGENAEAILNEIIILLQELLNQDSNSSIDLRKLPLSRWDYEKLQELLGLGEIHAEVGDPVTFAVNETGYSGVWWITHYNEEGEVIAEFIEISYCPEVLIAAVEDVSEGVEALRARSSALRLKV